MMTESSPTAMQHVLLVEDDDMHAELIRRAFEETPAIIITVARRLEEAKSALRQGMPDVVIADLRLPDGQGIELCQGDRDCPVVIMTSQGSEADAVEAMRAGALDYVVKSDAMFVDMPHVVDRALREWHLMKAHARADRFLKAQYEIASALATSSTLAEAGPRLLESICRCVGWPVGEFWRVDPAADVLRRELFWTAEVDLARFEAATADESFARGDGLPGATWAKGDAVSIPDLRDDPTLRWRKALTELQLRGAYGFPLRAADEIFGVFSFFTRSREAPNGDIHRLMTAISSHLGVFAQRQRAEEARERLQKELVESERLAAIGETAATLAHEIGNPLNSMYMLGQLLQRRIAKAGDVAPALAEGVDKILAENRRLNALLDEFRSMSRRQVINRTRVDLCALAERVLQMQAPMLRKQKIKWRCEPSGGLPAVSADEAKLTQVLLNIVKNAAEAMATGGKLTVRIETAAERIVVAIEDTGGGIPEGIDVFEPFRTTKESGTGLGLPVARQILAAHQGSLEYRSEVGVGTTFLLTLPVVPV